MLTGKVVRIAPFGAFVALEDGVDGLVHISQIAWEHVEKVEDALSIGQEVQVKVLEVDEDRKRISLSIKGSQRNAQWLKKPAAPAKPKRQPKPKSDIPTVNEELSNDAFALPGWSSSKKTKTNLNQKCSQQRCGAFFCGRRRAENSLQNCCKISHKMIDEWRAPCYNKYRCSATNGAHGDIAKW